LGFSAGWMFLAAKSASAATAALGFAGYLLDLLGWSASGAMRTWIAIGVCVALTAVVAAGIRCSNAVNAAIVSTTLVALIAFVAVGVVVLLRGGAARPSGAAAVPAVAAATVAIVRPAGDGPAARLLFATALMFVAYTGYGRIATLGEEVREPRRTIPRAIIATLIITAALYGSVAVVAVGALGADGLYAATVATGAPLEIAAQRLGAPGLPTLVALGAMTAMLGVLLNLLLGLSRVALAMGRRRDLPTAFGRLDAAGTTPTAAVLLVGVIVTGLAAIGSIRLAWTFSAFTVLIYYAITNLAALRLPAASRLYPRAISWLGLVACLGLAVWVPPQVGIAGLGLLGVGLVWRHVARQR
ncbi:MAG: APC family permease, partial [Acidobacteriota bacterium]